MHTFWLHLHGPIATQTPPPAGDGGDIALLVFLLLGLAFAALGWLVLKKKRAERFSALEEGSLEVAKELPEGTGTATVPPAMAEDLVAAEREALKARAAEDRARRARERLELGAQGQDGEARLAEAREREAEAQKRAEDAQARARQLSSALTATREGFVGRISKVIGAGKVDDGALDDLEAVLFTADIGPRTAERMLGAVRDKLRGKDVADASRVQAVLKDEARAILAGIDSRPLALEGETPRVIMILGVNGAGKTTTIGKLAHQLKESGKSVLLGAGDTFRAAAAEQLEVWAERAGAPIVQSDKEGADPSSVLFEAVRAADRDGIDVVLCDTAGRLHTKVNLMEELKKVTRVLGKAKEGAPHEVLLVLDGTVGQNAIQQAKQFNEAAPITGIVLTKLDGTAKGGVVLGIADELKIPVRYIGIGEKIGDLRPFDPDSFVDALFGEHAQPRPPAEESQACAPA